MIAEGCFICHVYLTISKSYISTYQITINQKFVEPLPETSTQQINPVLKSVKDSNIIILVFMHAASEYNNYVPGLG